MVFNRLDAIMQPELQSKSYFDDENKIQFFFVVSLKSI